jgi:RNA polymerase sigma factor (sigma-70 family)
MGNHTAELLRTIRPLEADHPDADLLARFADRRDEPAFRELVRRHGPLVLGVCRRVAGHAQDAEDAFQAVFVVLARKAGSIRRPELLGNWLYGVAVRVARRAKRAAARRRVRERQVPAMPEPPTSPAADWSDLAAVLDEELVALPEWYRTAVVLCDLQGLSRAEAAARLGVPEGTLSSRLAAGRTKLAERLARRGVTLPAAGLGVVMSASGTAAVPARLIEATVAAAVGGGVVPLGVLELAREGVWVMRAKLAGLTVVMGSAAVGLAVMGAPQESPQKPAEAPKQAVAKANDNPAADAKPQPVRPRVRRTRTMDFSGRADSLFWSDDGKKLAVVLRNLGDRIEVSNAAAYSLEGFTGAVVRVIDPEEETAGNVDLLLRSPSLPLGFLPGGTGFLSETRETGLINAHNRLEFWRVTALSPPPSKEKLGRTSPEHAAELRRRFVVRNPERTTDLDDLAGHLYAFAPDGRTFVNDFAETAPDGRVVRSGLRMIDAETGDVTRTLVRVDGQLYRIAISPDLTKAFTLGDGGTAQLWDLITGRPVWTKTLSDPTWIGQGAISHASFIRFSPDGRSIHVIDPRPEPPQDRVGGFGFGGGPESDPTQVEKRPPGSLQIGLNRIDARTGELLPQWPGAEAVTTLRGFSHDGRLLLTTDETLVRQEVSGQDRRGGGVFGSPPQASLSRVGSLSVWDTDTGTLVKRWPVTLSISAAFSPTKPVLAIFETVQPERPRRAATDPATPPAQSRLGFWDFPAPLSEQK